MSVHFPFLVPSNALPVYEVMVKSFVECLEHYKRQLLNLCIFGGFEEI